LFAVALVFIFLDGHRGWAEEWKGSYANSQGAKVANSTITFYKKGLSDGDWDDFLICNLTISKDKTVRTWMHYANSGKNEMKVYKVKAVKKGDGYLVSYEVYKHAVIQGVLAESGELLYKGSGSFTATPMKAD
jgi:hypothetical protein